MEPLPELILQALLRELKAHKTPPHRPVGTPPKNRRNPPGYRTAMKARARAMADHFHAKQKTAEQFLRAHGVKWREVERHADRIDRDTLTAAEALVAQIMEPINARALPQAA